MPLTFFPKPDQEEASVRSSIREFLQEHVAPTVREDDADSRFRRDVFNALAKKGFTALTVDPRYGGGGTGHIPYVSVLEETARVSMALAVTVGVTNLIQGALTHFGSEEQKDRFLSRMPSGEVLGAFSLSEPQSGSDAAGLRCAARKTDGGYRLTGTKCWCSTVGEADLYLVMARTGEHKTKGITAFLATPDMEGFRTGKKEDKLGMRASPLGELIFEDCFVPEENRIGKEGQGFRIALSQLDAGRITIGTAGLGVAIASLEKGFGKWAPELEEIAAQTFGEHYAYAQAVRSLVREAAFARDRKEKPTLLASQVKLLGSDLAVRVASDVISWMGPAGASPGGDVERYLRDAKALQIVEGTNQIQRVVLAREFHKMMENP